jgi:hypothetical protein
MRYQKTPLRSAINVYTSNSTPTHRNKKDAASCRIALRRIAAKVFSRNVLSERLCGANAATAKVGGCNASSTTVQKKQKHAKETIMETPTKQAPTASSDMVKLIRKLRWAGLEERAELLEKELEQHAITDTVVSMQNETD